MEISKSRIWLVNADTRGMLVYLQAGALSSLYCSALAFMMLKSGLLSNNVQSQHDTVSIVERRCAAWFLSFISNHNVHRGVCLGRHRRYSASLSEQTLRMFTAQP